MKALIALTVVMMMRIVGLIPGIALLKLPAAIAGLFARDMRQVMVLASGLGMVFTVSLMGLLAKKGLQWVHWSGEPV